MADLYYIEEGYWDPSLGYYVYTADVESAISAISTVSAEGTLVAIPIEADAILTSSSAIDVNVSVIRSSSATLQSNFSQTTLGQRTSDIDLFAFSDAALTVSALVIRDNNITASSVFNVAIDFVRTRSVSSDDNAAFVIDVINQRSRAFTIETQAAFSLTADVTAFIGTIQTLTSTSSLSATISIPVKGGAANLVATSSVFTSPKAGSLRPWNVTAGGFSENTYGTGIIESINSNSDSVYRTLKGNSWFFETYFRFDSYSNPTVDRTILTLGPLTVKHLANRTIQISIIDSTGTTRTRTSRSDLANGLVQNLFTDRDYYFAMYNVGTESNSFNAYWSSLNTATGIWTVYEISGIRGEGYFNWSTASNNKLKFYNPTGWVPRIKEVNYRIGNNAAYGLSSANTTIPYPTQNRINEPGVTQVLLHFNNNGNDDTGILVEVSAELNLKATVAFNGGIKIDGAAALASEASISATAEIAILFDIALNSQSALTASIDLVKDATANISSEFSHSTAGNIFKQLSSDISSAAAVSAIVSRTRDTNSSIQSEVTQTTTLTAILLGSADLNCYCEIDTVNATKTVDSVIYTEAVASNLTSVAKIGDTLVTVETVSSVSAVSNKTANAVAQLSSVAAIDVVGNLIVTGVTVLASSTQLSGSAIRIRGIASAISSSSTLALIPDVVFNASMAAQTSYFTLGANVQRLRGVDTAPVSQFVIDLIAQSQQSADAQLNSQFTQLTSGNTSASLASVLSTASALSCTISHIEGADLVAFNNAALTAIVEAGLFGSADLVSQSALNIQFTKILQAQGALEALADITNDFRLTRDLVSAVSVSSTMLAMVNRVVNPGSTMSTASTLDCTISHIEGADLEAFTNAALTTSARRLRGVVVNAASISSVSTTALRRKGFTVAIQSNSTLSVIATTVILLDANITSRFAVSARLSTRKQFSATIASAMSFVANVREIDADSINQNVWIITRENWEYTISPDNREYTINYEDRNYLIRR